MFTSSRYEVLENAESVDVEIWQEHISAFIKTFIVQEKRERWHHLCIEKSDKGRRDASKMYNDLIKSRCQKIDFEMESSMKKRQGKGIYYDFSGEAWWLTPTQAFQIGYGYESIFSLEKGGLVIYFWHELEEFLFHK